MIIAGTFPLKRAAPVRGAAVPRERSSDLPPDVPEPRAGGARADAAEEQLSAEAGDRDRGGSTANL